MARRSTQLTRTVLVVLAAVVASGIVPAPAAASPLASITLSPRFGPPTTPVTVRGSGFAHGESVKIWFGRKEVAGTTTDKTGGFVAAFNVPRGASPDQHGVKARGKTSGLKAKAIFTVRTNWSSGGSIPPTAERTPTRTCSRAGPWGPAVALEAHAGRRWRGLRRRERGEHLCGR